ncbi:MAG: hypothetical protein ABI678_19710 [Kofleriaceae bacterium]
MITKDFIRRRIMPVVLGVVIVLMSRESCHKAERTHATYVLSFGAAEPNVKAVDADMWMNGEQVSQFHRAALGDHIGPTQFSGSYPDHDGELRVDVELRSGQHRNLTRRVHADDDATVTVNLEYDLK